MNYTKSSWAVLAAIRFLLAVIVLNCHLAGLGIAVTGKMLYPLGRTAVLGFFLISGVSIAHSYRQRSQGFYTRRFLRIYPLYFAAILFTQGVSYVVHPPVRFNGIPLHPAGLLTTVANLLFLQNFAAIPMPYDSALWSLSIEVLLYLLTPLFIRLNHYVLLCIAAVSMFMFGFRGGAFLADLNGIGVVKYCWPWFIGFLLARDERKTPVIFSGLLGSLLFFLNRDSSASAANAFLFGSVLAIVVWAERARLNRAGIKTANFLGDVSYPLYLFHLPVAILLGGFGITSEVSIVTVVLVFVATLDFFYENKFKKVFWRPLTYSVVRLFPARWSLLQTV